MKQLCLASVLLLCAASGFAQERKVGLSTPAYVTAQVAGLAAVTTQEIAFAKLGAYDRFKVRRVLWGTVDGVTPWVLHKALKKVRRDVADALAGNLVGFFAPQVGLNIFYTVKLGGAK